MVEENSISIINRTNGQLTGEKAQALPVQLFSSWKWTRFVAIGFLVAVVMFIILLTTIRKQVVAVEVSGKADNFQIFQVQ